MNKSYLKDIATETIGTLLGGIILSLIFFIFSDFVHKPPNISGQWYFVNNTIDTSYSKFKNLNVYYKVMLIQQDSKISGYGEKIQDELNGKTIEYAGKNKIPIKISGYLKHNFISKDTLMLNISEEGSIRKSSTFIDLIRFSDDEMQGEFASTIADSSGSVLFRRSLNDLNNN